MKHDRRKKSVVKWGYLDRRKSKHKVKKSKLKKLLCLIRKLIK